LDEDRIRARVDAMLSSQTGTVPDYDLEWTSIYTFQCRRMKSFRHGPVLFAGDAAHQVSPFGARGANSGVQDADNLGWKLDLVCKGQADQSLLDSYATERAFGADENILNSSRSTDFMTPKSDISQIFRNAVLDLAGQHAFARPMVNSGRPSVPCIYDGFAHFGPDALNGPARTRPGAACTDAPVENGFLLDHFHGGFTLLALGVATPPEDALPVVHIASPSPALAERYLGEAPRALYLIRPDQHIVARWPDYDANAVKSALQKAKGKGTA